MAPEYGATTGYFPIDDATLAYLRQTGRDAAHVARVGAYAVSAGLALDPTATPRYTRVIEIALDQDVYKRQVRALGLPQLEYGGNALSAGRIPAAARSGLT